MAAEPVTWGTTTRAVPPPAAAAEPEAPAAPKVRELKPVDRERERVALVGLILVGLGFGAIYWPLGLIVPGAYLLAISFPRRR